MIDLLGYRMDNPTLYQIRVKGHLDEALANSFEGLTITNQEDGDALLQVTSEIRPHCKV